MSSGHDGGIDHLSGKSVGKIDKKILVTGYTRREGTPRFAGFCGFDIAKEREPETRRPKRVSASKRVKTDASGR